jgi:hypothetical protein
MLTPCTTQNDENSHANCSNPAPETAGGYNPNRMARAAQQLRSCDKLAPSGPSVQRLAECSAQPSHPTSITSAGAERLAFVHERLARQGYLPSRAIRRGMRRLAKLGARFARGARSLIRCGCRRGNRRHSRQRAPASVSSSPRDPRRSLGIELRRSEDLHVLLSKAAAKAVVEAASLVSMSRSRQSGRCSFHQRGFGSIIGEKC